MADEQPKFIDSTQYRVIYSNSFALTAGDNDFGLSFFIGGPSLGLPNDAVYRETTVMLTPRAAKIIAEALTNAVAHWESKYGSLVPTVPPQQS